MFSQRFYLLIWASFKFANFFGAIPYRFNLKTNQLIFSQFSFTLYKINMFLFALLEIFMGIQTVRFHIAGKMNHFNISYAFIIASGIIISCFLLTSVMPKALMATSRVALSVINYLKSAFYIY